MNGILNEQEQQIVASTKEKLESLREAVRELGDSEYSLAFDKILRELRGFDSELFIVSSMGMLKAGKSSLVNLLARSDLASPMGYGKDTTLRPALIMPATEKKPQGEIEVWFGHSVGDGDPQDDIQVQEKKRLREVFDRIRGVADDGTDSSSEVTMKTHPLTTEKLTNILCCQSSKGNELPREPILVVVRVPRKEESSLLSEKIVILDTPGLDSRNSKWTTSGWYSWLMEECDLYLFLQSSVAPLNTAAGNVLENIRQQKNEIPIWLIQNRMEAKHWQNQEVQDGENESQLTTAKTEFRKIVSNVNTYTVNLGKAAPKILDYDPARLKDGQTADKLLEDSGFLTLEKDIRLELEKKKLKLKGKRTALRKF